MPRREEPLVSHQNEAVVSVPYRIFATLKSGYIEHVADRVLRRLTRHEGRTRILNLGTPFGHMLAWYWQTDPDQAVIMLAHLLAQLRDHHPLAGEIDPPISLDELLRAVRTDLPREFADQAALTDTARRHVPGFYGART
jgi:hypothetical protein